MNSAGAFFAALRALRLDPHKVFGPKNQFFVLAVAAVIGGVAGLAAVGVHYLIDLCELAFGELAVLSEHWVGVAWPGVVLAPALGGLVVGATVYTVAGEARGHGVAEVMEALLLRGGYIRPRVAVAKAFTSAVCIGSGGSAGLEGPIIQVGASLGSTLASLFRFPPRLMRTFVACGAGGGLAASFNAPIAGSLFAVEIILGDFSFSQLAPVTVSAVLAVVVSHLFSGDITRYLVPHYRLVSPVELVPYLVLGLLAAGVAVAFILVMDAVEHRFEGLKSIHPIVKPALGGLAVGVIGLGLPQIFGMGEEGLRATLTGSVPALLAFALVAVKILSTSLTLGSGGSGGTYMPSLFLGAFLGDGLGRLVHGILPGLTEAGGAYAMAGMAAVAGAAAQAPLTGIVIVFELTNDYAVILPVMICTMVAVIAAHELHQDSIYTHKLRRRGLDLAGNLDVNLLKRLRVGDVLHREVQLIPHDLPFNFVVDLLLRSELSHLPVVDEQSAVIGLAPRDLAKVFLGQRGVLSSLVLAADVVQRDPPLLTAQDTLDQAVFLLHSHALGEIYVVDSPQTRRVVGVVDKGDLMDAYRRELEKRQTGDAFAYALNRPHGLEPVRLLDGYAILEIEAPHQFSGRSLRQLDLRNTYGVNVLAIKRREVQGAQAAWSVSVPESSQVLRDGDVLILVGMTQRLESLQHGW